MVIGEVTACGQRSVFYEHEGRRDIVIFDLASNINQRYAKMNVGES